MEYILVVVDDSINLDGGVFGQPVLCRHYSSRDADILAGNSTFLNRCDRGVGDGPIDTMHLVTHGCGPYSTAPAGHNSSVIVCTAGCNRLVAGTFAYFVKGVCAAGVGRQGGAAAGNGYKGGIRLNQTAFVIHIQGNGGGAGRQGIDYGFRHHPSPKNRKLFTNN